MSYTIESPFQYFPDPTKFGTLGLGSLYVGIVNGSPYLVPAQRQQVYVAVQGGPDLPISQPVPLGAGGVPLYNGSPCTLKILDAYSIAVVDYLGAQVYYSPRNGDEITEIDNLQAQIDAIEANEQAIIESWSAIASTPVSVAGKLFTLKQHTSGGLGGGTLMSFSGSVTDDGGTQKNALGSFHLKRITGQLCAFDFGAINDNSTDNSAAFAAISAYLNSFSGTTAPPKIRFDAGYYRYATSPNWAIKNATIECAMGTFFICTGTGPAFVIDGGASGPGISGFNLLGSPTIKGNASCATGLYARAIHRSTIEANIRDVSDKALHTVWCVTSRFKVKVSPIGEPSFSPAPVTGMFLDVRGVGETTSNCTFDTPIAEGVSGYGINLNAAVMNTFLGGTSESNAGGIFVSADSAYNTFINSDLEFNTGGDVFCVGSYNNFIGVLSDDASRFEGVSNTIIGGIYNDLTDAGVDNLYDKVRYASNAGAFTLSGTNVTKRAVRNVTSSTIDADVVSAKLTNLNINGPSGNDFIQGAAPSLTGGSANDLVDYKYGTGNREFWFNGVKNVTMGPNVLGFYATAPIAKPAVTGAKAGNAALTSLLTQLAALGIITDSST